MSGDPSDSDPSKAPREDRSDPAFWRRLAFGGAAGLVIPVACFVTFLTTCGFAHALLPREGLDYEVWSMGIGLASAMAMLIGLVLWQRRKRR